MSSRGKIKSWWQKGDENWQQGHCDEAIWCYEQSVKKKETAPRVRLFLALLYLGKGEKRLALKHLEAVRQWNAFDLTVRDLELQAEEIIKKRVKVVRFPHIIGLFSSDDNEGYKERFGLIERVYKEVVETVGKTPFAPVVLAEIVESPAPISRGGVLLRSLLPRVEIAAAFCGRGIIAHELTHVLYPSMNLFLTEALSLFVQEKVGGEEKGWPFPFEEKEIDEAEERFVEELIEESIFSPRFFTTESIVTGKSLLWYQLAWKWITTLVEKRGMDVFYDLYEMVAYGDRDVRETFVGLYNTRDLWLRHQQTKPQKVFGDSEEVTETTFFSTYTQLQEDEKNWMETQNEQVLQRLCQRGFAFVTYLRGAGMGKGREHPDFTLLEKYLEKLENWFKRAQQIWPEDPILYCMLAEVYGMQTEIVSPEKRLGLAFLIQKEVKKALEIDPECVEIKVTLGKILLFTPKIFGGGVTRARSCFREVLAKDPEHIEALFWDGYAAWEEGKKVEAKSKWEEVLARQPSHSFATRMLHKLCEEMKDA